MSEPRRQSVSAVQNKRGKPAGEPFSLREKVARAKREPGRAKHQRRAG